MADAASSATATVPAPRPRGAGSNVPVDAVTVRQSCQAFLSASQGVAGQAWEGVGGLLRGHVQLLVPAFAWVEPQFRGEQWRIAQQILTGARQRLAEGIGTSPRDIWDLAVGCRALLVLLEYPSPLRAAGPGGWS